MGAGGLEPLLTVCPHCGTRFRVTESQLQAARGRVRCGACGSVFDGVEQLVLDTPREFATTQDAEQALDELMAELMADTRVVPPPRGPEPPAALPESSGLQAPEPAAAAVPEPSSELAPEAPSARGAEPPSTEPTAAEPQGSVEAASTASEPAPTAEEPGPATPSPFSDAVVFGPPRRMRRRWIWPLALLAALVVTAQVLWFRFDVLVRDPAWRPLYGWICSWAGCELPVQRAPALIRTRNLTVQSAGIDGGSLVVRVLIVNEAAFPQPFPALELRFSELNGAVVAGHRFLPGEYLSGDARNLTLMPMGTPVQIELRIPDPGPHAVNYELDLR
jgi:predicted Zn finger-like uncharacterized protein